MAKGPLLIVVGTSLRAEEADRPLAYYLKRQIEAALADGPPEGRGLPVYVVADLRWIQDESFQNKPTVSLGGPGVNLLAHRWFEEIPFSLAVENQLCVQLDPTFNDLRASIWGMDNASTQVAVAAFVQRYLPRFLEHAMHLPDELPEHEEEDDDEDEED